MVTRIHHWGDFKRWCAARGMKALPAHPWTIATYLRWVDRRKDARAAREALDAISREHVLKTARAPNRHATVQRTMDMIERRAEVRDQHADLFDEDSVTDASSPPPPEPEEGNAEEGEIARHRRMLNVKPRLVRRRPRGSSR